MRTLSVRIEKNQESMTLYFIGDIDEKASFDEIKIGTAKEVILDMGEVEHINSYGSRQWVKWANSTLHAPSIKFIKCSPIFLDYVNMIQGFLPVNAVIESFKVPYYCEKCSFVTFRTYESHNIKDTIKDITSTTECQKCNEDAIVDVVVQTFFKFLKLG